MTPPLLTSTLTAVTPVAVVPAEITALVQGVLKTMTLTRLKAAVAVMLGLALLSGSAAWLARPLPAAPPNTVQTAPQGQKPIPDRQRLQGEWAVVSEVQNGKDVTGAGCQALIFAGDVLTFRGKTESGAAVFDLCPLTKTKRIDVVFPRKGWTLLGAYRLEGNLLTLCLAAPGTRRPAAFESRDGSHVVLYVLKRRSPGVRQTRTSNQPPSIGFTSDFGITGSIVLNERNFDVGMAVGGGGQESRQEPAPGTQPQRHTRPTPESRSTTFPVTFVDSGTVEGPPSSKGARASAGAGVRFTVPGTGPAPMALDFGFPIVKGVEFPQSQSAVRGRYELAETCRLLAAEESRLATNTLDKRTREHRLKQQRLLLRKAVEQYTALKPYTDGRAGSPLAAAEQTHVLFSMAECLFNLGEYTTALALYDGLAERYKDRPERLVALGGSARCYGASKDFIKLQERLQEIRVALPTLDTASRRRWEVWLKDAARQP
jgi:uncharacterized protein (TIGR03067 family)